MVHPHTEDINLIQQKGCLRGTMATVIETITVDAFQVTPPICPLQNASMHCGTEVYNSVEAKASELNSLHEEIQSIAGKNINLLQHALYHARKAKGTLLDVAASPEDGVEHPLFHVLFRQNDGNDSLKRKNGS
jgi:hypothetical protein